MAQSWNRQPYARIRQSRTVPYDSVRVINPSRGLNLLVADILVNDKEATAGTKNNEYTEGGAVKKRMGYTAAGSGLTNAPRGLGKYMSESANYPITSDGGVLKKFQSNVWSTLSGSVTLDVNSNVTFTSLFQKTYAWDGVNGGVVFDGTTVTRPGTMPRAKFSVVYKGYHVAAGVAGQPFRVYFAPSAEPSRFTWSTSTTTTPTDDIELNNATEVPGSTVFTGDSSPRAIDINKNDGEKVTGLGFFQDVLIVFKENSIYQLYFNESNGFVVERISSSYGAVCHGAIASVENDCYFLTEQGVYVLGNEPNYYAAIRTNELSSRIKPLLEQITPAQYEKCKAIYYQDRYFLTVPIRSTDVNAVIVYDRRFYAWAYWDNLQVNDMLIFKDKDVDNATYFYYTHATSAQLMQFTPGVYSDNGQPIEFVFRTRAFEGKHIELEKYWYVIRPVFRNTTGDVQVSYITENGSEGKPVSLSAQEVGGIGLDQFGALRWGTAMSDEYTDADLGLSGTAEGAISSDTDISHAVFDLAVGLDSRVLKVDFRNSGLNEGFTLLGWVLLFQEKDLQRFDGSYTIR